MNKPEQYKILRSISRLTLFFSVIGSLAMCSACSITRSSFQKNTGSEEIKKIIYYGSLAGNSHNTQPWIVKIKSDTQFEIHADFSRKLHIVDDSARGLYISLGAFIENCVIAAKAYGYDAQVTYTAEKNSDRRAAAITLAAASKSAFDLSELELRRTLRTPFSKKPITSSHLKALLGNENDTHYFAAGSSEAEYIAANSLLAYSQQSRDPKAAEELAKWIRFSNSDVKAKRDGLTTAGMGIDGIAGFFVSNFMKPEDSKENSFIEQGIKKAEAQLSNYAGFIVIAQSADTPAGWMQTGRIYERINIRCRSMMIGCHPINALIEEDNYEREAAKSIPVKGSIQMIVRIGYVDSYPEAVSVRRDINEIIQ
jgi:hypothetical protein